jgi:hypothetical protein
LSIDSKVSNGVGAETNTISLFPKPRKAKKDTSEAFQQNRDATSAYILIKFCI